MRKSRSGFTIVELLIVIVVIAILAAITIIAYNGIQQRARDAERVSDMNSIKKALELYYVDHGYYPNSSQVINATFQKTELSLNNSNFISPTGGVMNYCWASSTNQYCYVATRPSPLTGDCTGGGSADPNETCIKYRLSYRLEQDPNTMTIVYSPNW